jgi:hypothetical protein
MPEIGPVTENNSIIPNPGVAMKGRFFFIAIVLASLPVFFAPLSNPDLFWDFSAAHWMLAHHAFPKADFLSFTKAGAPWVDFEWLSQIIFFFFYRQGGFLGLLFLKAFLLYACWKPIALGLKDIDLPRLAIATAFLFWISSLIAHSDLRSELFSLFFFALMICLLERRQAKPQIHFLKWASVICLIFALWANLHAGFIFGEALLIFYAVGDICAGDLRRFRETVFIGVLAMMATLLNPYGLGPYRIAFAHLKEGSNLAHSINEWEAFTFFPTIHWPIDLAFLALLILGGMTILSPRIRKKNVKAIPFLFLAVLLGLLTLFYRRFASYFVIVLIFASAKFLKQTRPSVVVSAFLALFCVLSIFHFARQTDWSVPFNARMVPERAVAFLNKERPAISNLRVYNEWEWGGYLGWELRPWYKVYCDGRYLFHDLLFHLSVAVQSADTWQKFLNSQGLNAALMPNLSWHVLTTRIYPDKTTRKFQRPWYLLFMPRKQWALVYWDDKALFFVKRGAVPVSWIQRHEYRFWHPYDTDALKDALRRGEISESILKKEEARHLHEIYN